MPNPHRPRLRDETGATAIEYGLIAGLIATVIIVAVSLVGSNVEGLLMGLATEMGAAP